MVIQSGKGKYDYSLNDHPSVRPKEETDEDLVRQLLEHSGNHLKIIFLFFLRNLRPSYVQVNYQMSRRYIPDQNLDPLILNAMASLLPQHVFLAFYY